MAGTTKVDSQLLEPCIFTSSCLGKWTFERSSKLPIHPLIMRGNWNYRVPIPIDPWMDSNEANTRPKLLLVWISTNNAIATCVQVTVSGWMHKIDTSWVMQQWAVVGPIQTEQGGLSVDGSKKITVDKPCFWFGLFPCWQTLFFYDSTEMSKGESFYWFLPLHLQLLDSMLQSQDGPCQNPLHQPKSVTRNCQTSDCVSGWKLSNYQQVRNKKLVFPFWCFCVIMLPKMSTQSPLQYRM